MPDASDIKFDGKMQFKKDKYTYNEIEYTVEGEWLNGVPHGVCIIDRADIRGVYTFTQGIPNGGPSWWENKEDGMRISKEFVNENDENEGIFRLYYSD